MAICTKEAGGGGGLTGSKRQTIVALSRSLPSLPSILQTSPIVKLGRRSVPRVRLLPELSLLRQMTGLEPCILIRIPIGDQ